MRKRGIIVALPLLLALPVCGSVGGTRQPLTATQEQVRDVPVRDAGRAIKLFQRYWDSIVLPGLREGNPKRLWAQSMCRRVRATDKLYARRRAYRELYRSVNGTLSPVERRKLILYGSPADLNREGEGWVVESSSGCPCGEIAGCVDAKSGRLIFVWLVPEG
jgi:hypothetical protein